MKVIITGATGFLGFRACEYFHELGYEVVGIGRNEQKGKQLMEQGIHFEKLDLIERDQLVHICKGMDAVIHSAALSESWGEYKDFYRANVECTENVLYAIRMNNIKRLVHISTPSLYFNLNSREYVKENEPLPKTFVNAYAATKYIAEEKVLAAVETGLDAIILRPRALFGPRDTTILPRLIELNRTRGVPLPNDGQAVTDLTYVDNVVRAIELALKAPTTCSGEVYNITNDEPVILKDALEKLFFHLHMPFRAKKIPYSLLRMVATTLEMTYRLFNIKKEPLVTKYSVSVLGETQTLSVEKAREELGYTPIVSIEKGIETYAEWWKKHHQSNNSF